MPYDCFNYVSVYDKTIFFYFELLGATEFTWIFFFLFNTIFVRIVINKSITRVIYYTNWIICICPVYYFPLDYLVYTFPEAHNIIETLTHATRENTQKQYHKT